METIFILALAGSCYGLSPDQQAYCQAREHQNVSYCYNITDASLRASCRAEIHDQPDICSSISDAQERQVCRNRASGN